MKYVKKDPVPNYTCKKGPGPKLTEEDANEKNFYCSNCFYFNS